jgi:general secretion pathway protein A
MYANHYGLTELPFSIAPDPHYLFMSQQHREALAHLTYGIGNDGGFVLLTGEIGTGKTTICRCFLEQLPEQCDAAFILNPKMNVAELLSTICQELHIPCPADNTGTKAFVDRINSYLLESHANGRTTVLIIDEAQNLDRDVLEQIRLLTNLETNQRKLLHIILLGQPELREMLARPELQQLSQRIIARYHLGPLQQSEIEAYIGHRVTVAGGSRALFPSAVAKLLYRLSGGIPRKVNILCDRALLGTYVQGKEQVDRRTLLQAAKEVEGRTSHGPRLRLVAGLGTLVSATALATALYYYAEPPLATAPKHGSITQPKPYAPPPPSISSTTPSPVAGVKTAATALPTTSENRGPQGLKLAYQSLLAQWKITASAEDEPTLCLQAETFGLRCLSGQGDLALLRRLDLPALLQLRGPSGAQSYVTLTSLRASRATVLAGTQPVTVAASTLGSQWSGHFTLLWKAPPNYQGPVARGSRGLVVAWLRNRLSPHPEQTGTSQTNQRFDDALTQQVMQFQQNAGLKADGIVGPYTLIQLPRPRGDTSPRLAETEG